MVGFIRRWFVNWLAYETPPTEVPMCDYQKIRYELKMCDVLLIEGRSRVSEVIKMITQSAWSHSALYIGRLHDIEDETLRSKILEYNKDISPDTQLLIEGMIGKGIIISPLSDYEEDHIRICRPKGLSHTDAQKVIKYSVNQLGFDYDIRHIFDLFRFLVPWSFLPRTWRSTLFNYNPTESTRNVCSSMIAGAFAHVKFPILPVVKKHETKGVELYAKNPKLFTPRDFDYSPYFEIIKYPFIDNAHQEAGYKNLPWEESGVMVHNEAEVDKKKEMEQKAAQTPVKEKIKKNKSFSLARFSLFSKTNAEESEEEVSPEEKEALLALKHEQEQVEKYYE